MSTTAEAPPLLPGNEEIVTFWDITGKQFRKNRPAMVALYCIAGLVVIATGAPIISMNIPYVMKTKEGLSWPLFDHLFNRLVFPSGVDVYFNLLLIVGPAWWLGARAIRSCGLEGNAPDRTRTMVYGGLLALLLAFYATLAAMANPIYGRLLGGTLAGLGLLALQSWRIRSMPPRLVRMVRVRTRFLMLLLFLVGFVLTLTTLRYTSPVMIHGHEYRVEVQRLADSGEGWAVSPYFFNHPTNVGEVGALVVERKLHAPSWPDLPLGTDLNGRDAFSRIVFGTRISLTIGIVAVSIYVTIGVVLGSIAGYFGGKTDLLIIFALQVMICIPTFFLLLTIVSIFQTRSIFMIMTAIGLIGWTGVTRIVRGEFMRHRESDYVMAARALGIPERRIIFGHILKNALSPVLVTAAFGVAAAILTESALAFIGLGDPSVPSWGQMLTTGRDEGKLWLIWAPGMAIFFVVTVLNMVGDGLRDALDPKLRQ